MVQQPHVDSYLSLTLAKGDCIASDVLTGELRGRC